MAPGQPGPERRPEPRHCQAKQQVERCGSLKRDFAMGTGARSLASFCDARRLRVNVLEGFMPLMVNY